MKRFAAGAALRLLLLPLVWAQDNPLASLQGSIVYIREGNVWAFTPSTAQRRPLTLTAATAAPPWPTTAPLARSR